MTVLGWCLAVAFALLFARQCRLTAQRDRALIEVVVAAIDLQEQHDEQVEALSARGVYVIPPDFFGPEGGDADMRA